MRINSGIKRVSPLLYVKLKYGDSVPNKNPNIFNTANNIVSMNINSTENNLYNLIIMSESIYDTLIILILLIYLFIIFHFFFKDFFVFAIKKMSNLPGWFAGINLIVFFANIFGNFLESLAHENILFN